MSADLEKLFSGIKETVDKNTKAVEETKKTAEETKKTVEGMDKDLKFFGQIIETDDRMKFMSTCMKEEGMDMTKCSARWEEKQKKAKAGEKLGLTEEQYGAPAIAKVLKFLKGKLEDADFKKILGFLGVKEYEKPYGKPGAGEQKTGEQYEAPTIARGIRYLKRVLNERQLKHYLKIIGAKEEKEQLVLPDDIPKEKMLESLMFLKKETSEVQFNRYLGLIGVEEETFEEGGVKGLLPTGETYESLREKQIKGGYELLSKERHWGEAE